MKRYLLFCVSFFALISLAIVPYAEAAPSTPTKNVSRMAKKAKPVQRATVSPSIVLKESVPSISTATTLQQAVPAAVVVLPATEALLVPQGGILSPPAAAFSSAVSAPDPPLAFAEFWNGLKGMLPSLPTEGRAILPVIKIVYPTGEKPLVVVTFKCPTEVVGITTPPIKALHEIVTFGMNGLNRSNLFSFDLQQVCS